MQHPFLTGKKLYLRPLEVKDLEGPYLDWLNDHQINRFLETGNFPSTRESLEQYYRNTAQNSQNVMLAIIDKRTDKHVGNIKLGPIHWIHRRADMGILIGEKDFWSLGYGEEAVSLVTAYGFERLNLHKITLGVYVDHQPAVKLYEKLGFKVEGILKQHLFCDGLYHDKYVMGLLYDEYRAVSRGFGKQSP